ncbi:uncharacterized protein LOC119148659 [Falco rusticolus]|uniref:uncharacterized protein LOC119148659 n=1 Tax=Falco rusticolus TaxID=120794 RepID=UPI0018868A1A|nr:uncharacterized protein LOC119148659 [Falco rusticolus]XP_055567836.1 uncharacterized protein LOC114017121 [Falco cherrug]
MHIGNVQPLLPQNRCQEGIFLPDTFSLGGTLQNILQKRIWQFLHWRRVRGGPVPSKSSSDNEGGELQPQGQEELQHVAAIGNLAPGQPWVKELNTNRCDKDDRHSPTAQPVDPREQKNKGEAAPGCAKGVPASSAVYGAGAAGVTWCTPALGRADEPAVQSEPAIRKSPAAEEAIKESKSSGGELQTGRKRHNPNANSRI